MNFLIKLSVSGLLIVLISRNVDLHESMLALSSVSASALAIALLLQVASNGVATLRWFVIMSKIGFKQPFFFYLKSFFKGAFFNQGLPTSIGGDGLRILDCTASSGTTEDAVFGVFIDRIIGLAGLLLLNILALLLDNSLLPANIYFPLLTLLVLLCVALVGLFFLRNANALRSHRHLGFLARLSQRYAQVYSNTGAVALQTGLSVLTHLLSMSAFFVIGRSLGLDYSLTVYLALVPPVILLTILPISLAGWGVREGAMVGFFVMIGAEKSLVLTFSVLYGLLALVASIPGLFVYIAQQKRL